MSDIQVGQEFINKIAARAIQKRIEREIRHQVGELVRELMVQLFGSTRFKGKAKRGMGKKLPDLRKKCYEALEGALTEWLSEILGEEVGGDLIQYVTERVRFMEDDEEEEEEEDEPEGMGF